MLPRKAVGAAAASWAAASRDEGRWVLAERVDLDVVMLVVASDLRTVRLSLRIDSREIGTAGGVLSCKLLRSSLVAALGRDACGMRLRSGGARHGEKGRKQQGAQTSETGGGGAGLFVSRMTAMLACCIH